MFASITPSSPEKICSLWFHISCQWIIYSLSLSNHKRTFLKYGAFKMGITAINSQFSCKYLTDSRQIYAKRPNKSGLGTKIPQQISKNQSEFFVTILMIFMIELIYGREEFD